jgi:hypothetical protein
MTSSNAIGDWSSSCSATSSWPATVRTGACTNVSVMSAEVTAVLSAVCAPVAVPVATFGRLIESVPAGSGMFRHRFAVCRPKRGRSMNWSTIQRGRNEVSARSVRSGGIRPLLGHHVTVAALERGFPVLRLEPLDALQCPLRGGAPVGLAGRHLDGELGGVPAQPLPGRLHTAVAVPAAELVAGEVQEVGVPLVAVVGAGLVADPGAADVAFPALASLAGLRVGGGRGLLPLLVLLEVGDAGGDGGDLVVDGSDRGALGVEGGEFVGGGVAGFGDRGDLVSLGGERRTLLQQRGEPLTHGCEHDSALPVRWVAGVPASRRVVAPSGGAQRRAPARTPARRVCRLVVVGAAG